MTRQSPVVRHGFTLLLMGIFLAGGNVVRAQAPQASTHLQNPLVHLPADQAGHTSAHNEWWYIVGHLRAGSRTFGYQMTAFKFGQIKPPGFTTPITLYRSDLAITDESRHRFYHAINYYFPQSVRLSTSSLDVHVGSIALTGLSREVTTLRAGFGNSAMALRFTQRRPAMYVGGSGYIPMGNGFTYYYSLTDLSTSGTLRVAGTTFRITGISWLDHQWGNWQWQSIRGWTWMAWQLSNGVQMSVFDFRSVNNRVTAASVLLANGKQRTVTPVMITSTGVWTSPHSHARYPSGWVVRIPSLGATMQVHPTVLDQEMTSPGQIRISYWEGSSRLHGTFMNRPVTGLGYTELTGYASRSAMP